MLTKLYFLW